MREFRANREGGGEPGKGGRSIFLRPLALWPTALSLIGIAAILSFQNCTQPAGTDSSSVDAEAASLGFVYNTQIDQIAYMSCSGLRPATFDNSAYFSFRVGAYRSGGINLRQSFLDKYIKKPAIRRSDLILASPANTATILQIAIRDINQFQSIRTAGGTPAVGADYDNLFTALGVPDITDALVNSASNAPLRYFRNGNVNGARIEGNLSFADGPDMTSSIRQFTTNTAYLALTYSHASTTGSTETLARSPYDLLTNVNPTTPASTPAGTPAPTIDSNRVVFGTGYGFRFGQPTVAGLNTQFPQVALREVNEYNLENLSDHSATHTWVCPDTMQFRIVRMEDLAAAGANCTLKPDPPTLPADLAIVRNSLRFEDWYVDMTNHCIIPKKSGPGCYGTATAVIYTPATACDANNPAANCVSYASVCTRN
jgi:hypothetical protein